MAFAIIFPAAFLLSACDGKDGKKVQSITVDNLFIGDSVEYEYGTNINDIFSLENMEVTAIYDDNSTKVLSSDEYTVEFSKNTNPIDEIESIPDVGYYGISVSYEGVFHDITFTVIPSSYYSISLSHKSWTYGNDDIPKVTLENYQQQEGDSVDFYYIEKSKYDALSDEEKELAYIHADGTYIADGTMTLDAGQYYVFAYINFANESNYKGLTVIDDNTLITVNKKRIDVTPEDAAGVSAWIFDYSNSYNTSSDGKYIIGDIALKDIYLENVIVTISGAEGYFNWKDPEETLNSSNSGDSYPLVFIPYDPNNYEVVYSGGEITLQVTIEKGVIDNKNTLDIYFADYSESEAKTIAYDGKQHSLLLDSFEIFDAGGVLKNIVTFTQNGKNVVVREETPEGGVTAYYIDGLVERGQYTFTVSIVDTTNYCWTGGDTTPATFTVTIE